MSAGQYPKRKQAPRGACLVFGSPIMAMMVVPVVAMPVMAIAADPARTVIGQDNPAARIIVAVVIRRAVIAAVEMVPVSEAEAAAMKAAVEATAVKTSAMEASSVKSTAMETAAVEASSTMEAASTAVKASAAMTATAMASAAADLDRRAVRN